MQIPFRFALLTLSAIAASQHAIAAAPMAPQGTGTGPGGPGGTSQGGLGHWDKVVDTLYHNNPAVVTDSCNSQSQASAQAGTDVSRTWGGGFAVDNSHFCSVSAWNATRGFHEESWVYTPGEAPDSSLLGGARGNCSTEGLADAYARTGNSAALVGGYAHIDCSIMPLLKATLVAVSTEGSGTLNNIEWAGPSGETIYLTVPQGTTTGSAFGRTWARSDEYRNSDGIVHVDVVEAMTKTGIFTELYADEDIFIYGNADASFELAASLHLTLFVL